MRSPWLLLLAILVLTAPAAADDDAITDDAEVRARLVDDLIARGVITAKSARTVPTRKQLAKKLRALLRSHKRDLTVTPDDCWVTGARGASVVLRCHADRCRSGCIEERLDVEILAGKRWKLLSSKGDASDTGACGCCMHVF